MKTVASKTNINRSSKRSHALKELLEKHENNMLEIKEDLPFKANSQTGNIQTVQFASARQALPAQSPSNLSEAGQALILIEIVAKTLDINFC